MGSSLDHPGSAAPAGHKRLFSRGLYRTVVYLALLSTALLLWIGRRRVVPFFTLGSTYLFFPLAPTPILGEDDSFDLFALSKPSPAEELVPRVIHQVKLGSGYDMRPEWTEARDACIALHPGWEFKLWTDETGDAFVKEAYPDLFDLYRSYPQEIMRSNVLRYLALAQYGGIYLDLDLKCRVPLDAFLTQEFVTPPAQPTGVNNAFIVARPKHPFFAYVAAHLASYNLSWFGSPYVTNMFSTGCHFFSTMHLFFPSHAALRVLPWSYRLNGHVTTPLFEHLGASSWHRSDARLILSLGERLERLKPFLPFASVGLALGLLVLGSALHASARRRAGYDPLTLAYEPIRSNSPTSVGEPERRESRLDGHEADADEEAKWRERARRSTGSARLALVALGWTAWRRVRPASRTGSPTRSDAPDSAAEKGERQR